MRDDVLQGMPSDAGPDASFLPGPRPPAARTLMRHTLLYLPAQIIGPVTQFVAILVFTHWLAPEPYGVLTYVLASQDFVFFLCVAWWSQYTVRYLGQHMRDADDRYRRSEGAILVGTAVAQVVAALFALWLLSQPAAPLLQVATVAYMLTRCFNLHLGERARARSDFLDYTIAATIGPLVGFLVAFLVVALVAATPTAALFGYAAVQAVSLVWLMVRQDIPFRLWMPDRTLLRQAFAFGLPLIVAGVAAWCGMNAIRVLVDRDMGATAMGLVAVGWGLGHRLTSSVSMLMTVAAFPLAVERFRGGAPERAFREITRNGLLMLGIVLPAAVGLYLIQGDLIPLVVAAPFRTVTLAVLPAALAAGVARNIRTHVADQIFVLVERTSIVGAMTIAEALLVVAGCIVGLVLGGAVGAAIGSAAGYIVAMVVGFVVARMRAGLDLPFAEIGLIVAATALMALAVSLIEPRFAGAGGEIATIVLKVLAGIVVYAAAILVLFPRLARSGWSRWRRLYAPRSWKKS